MTILDIATPSKRPASPTSGQAIITLFGLYARLEHNWLPVAGIVSLMSELGFDAPAARSAVSRLKRRGILQAMPGDDGAGYSLAADTLAVIREGDHRIFDLRRAGVADGWLLIVFSVPETERGKRHELRKTLIRLGCGSVAPGVWIIPDPLAAPTRGALTRAGLMRYVDLFRADYRDFGDLSDKVAQWWDLEALHRAYEQFLDRYRLVNATLDTASPPMRPKDAFTHYVPMLTDWRRLPYLDPALPLAVLPADWIGVEAGAVFARLNRRLRGPARRHAMAIIRR
jgi:phenylacetic acid degradation operon negative regulatory protein